MSKIKKWFSNLLERIGNAKAKPEYDYETVTAYSKSCDRKKGAKNHE